MHMHIDLNFELLVLLGIGAVLLRMYNRQAPNVLTTRFIAILDWVLVAYGLVMILGVVVLIAKLADHFIWGAYLGI